MGAENLTPHRDSIPGPSSPYQVAIPIALSWPINYSSPFPKYKPFKKHSKNSH